MPPAPPTPDGQTPGAPTIAVVIPCYRVSDHVLNVIDGIGREVSHVFVVDDVCPDRTGEHVLAHCKDRRVQVLTHEHNVGVGGATMTGYRKALEAEADIIVKLDGGRPDEPLADSGTRRSDRRGPRRLRQGKPIPPPGRADPDAGRAHGAETCCCRSPVSCPAATGTFSTLPTDSRPSTQRWHTFFRSRRSAGDISSESDMLFRLNIMGAVVVDVPMQAKYGNERSNLRIFRAMFEFSAKHWINTAKRIFYAYFLRDFSVASIELVLGQDPDAVRPRLRRDRVARKRRHGNARHRRDGDPGGPCPSSWGASSSSPSSTSTRGTCPGRRSIRVFNSIVASPAALTRGPIQAPDKTGGTRRSRFQTSSCLSMKLIQR